MLGTVVLSALLPAVGLAIAAWNTWLQIRSKQALSKAVHVQSNAVDLEELKKQLNAEDLDAATALVRKYIKKLPEGEQREAEEALDQPSLKGRANYIRRVVG